MKLSIHADIELDTPDSASRAYVTWLGVQIVESNHSAPDNDTARPGTNLKVPAFEPHRGRIYGTARVAVVHVGEIADAYGDLFPALRKMKLESLGDAYFAHGWYRDEFADGAGIDLLYIESIEIDASHRHKNVDLAAVRRLCDTLGSGCQLAVLRYGDALAAGHWRQLGFTATTPGRTNGFMHMKLGYRHAQVVDASGSGDFEVLPTVILHDRHLDN